jgi:hypothetical protein
VESVSPADAPADSLEVRERLIEALELDLVGPWEGHEFSDELLPGWVRPSNWYLTGFLIPTDAPREQSADDDADDELDAVPETEGEEGGEERGPAKKGFFPSSMGLSALVDGSATSLSVTVRWGDYEPGEHRSGSTSRKDRLTRNLRWCSDSKSSSSISRISGLGLSSSYL